MNEKLEEYREKNQEKVTSIFKYFSSIMGVFYMVLAVVFFYFPLIENMDTWAKISISVMLFVYGAFRLWRAIKS
jgi:hypothetical protein